MISEIEVTIIVPAFNEEEEISNCLDSLLRLNYPKNKYEIIVVDDGSRDRTPQIVRNYEDKYFNIRLLSKKNGGKASAQNLGLKHANGKYILVTDADATPEINWVTKMVKDLQKHDLVIGSWYPKSTNYWGEKIQNSFCLMIFKYHALNRISDVGVNNGFKKEIVTKVGDFNESKLVVLSDFMQRAIDEGFNVFFDPEIVVYAKCTKSIKNLLMQKLRWREDILSISNTETFKISDLLGIGYTFGLTFVLFLSFCISIISLDFKYFLYSFFIVYCISFLVYSKGFVRLFNCKKERVYAGYFLEYLIFEILLVRLSLFPYLIYRALKPRGKPVFDGNRD